MCWAINIVGERKAVREYIKTKCEFIPEYVRTAILETILDPEETTTNGVRIEGEGHNFTGGSHYRSIDKLKVENIKIII